MRRLSPALQQRPGGTRSSGSFVAQSWNMPTKINSDASMCESGRVWIGLTHCRYNSRVLAWTRAVNRG